VPLRSRRWLVAANIALIVAALDVLVGWALISLIDAETVLVTAPILFLAGLILILACRKVGVLMGMILGLAHCSICLLFTMLVNVWHWGPRDASKPFTVMAGVYLILVVIPLSAAVFLRLRRVPTTDAPRGVL
jgi:ABC-type microcin C transport system permease subunit YejE